MTPASFHPAAGQELLDAVAYYEAQAPGLGIAFLDKAERTVGLIRRFPTIGPAIEADIRRLALARFPFSILYRLPADTVRILAVMHHRQRTGYWQERR